MGRVRLLNEFVDGGIRNISGTIVNDQLLSSRRFVEDDNSAIGDNHYLRIEKSNITGGRLTRVYSGTNSLYTNYFDYRIDWFRNYGNLTNRHATTDRPSNSVLIARALANSSPNSPTIDLPVFLAEILDIRDTFASFSKGWRAIADANLRYQFGIRPLVSDILTAIDFAQAVSQRVKDIQRLQAGKPIKKTVVLGNFSGTRQDNIKLQSLGFDITSIVRVRTTLQVKAHVRWKAVGNAINLPEFNVKREAIIALLGLDVSPATVWEAVPFSWLADYFSNIGTMLATTRNTLPIIPSQVSLMEHMISDVTCDARSWPASGGYSAAFLSACKANSEVKTRSRVSPTFAFSLDEEVLSTSQSSILASLSALKRAR